LTLVPESKSHLFDPFLHSKAQQRALERLPNVAQEDVFLEVAAELSA
jgi:hypothetical protein